MFGVDEVVVFDTDKSAWHSEDRVLAGIEPRIANGMQSRRRRILAPIGGERDEVDGSDQWSGNGEFDEGVGEERTHGVEVR